MKTKRSIFRFATVLCCVLFFACCLPLWAQGTAFTYQGILNDGAAAANGSYDLRFAIFDGLSAGTQQGGTLTNTATAVSNGLFTVTLDFGNQFPGANRWLEVGVRTNGSGAFATLSPRQQITSVPHALVAANFSGAVSDSQLSPNIARLDAPQTFSGPVTFSSVSNTYSGTFIGNGAGMTNVPGASLPQVVTGSGVQAQANTDYSANSAAQVSLNLPANASVGDVVRVSGLGSGGWQVLPSSGQSINGIATVFLWIARANSGFWRSVASSADGSKLVAVQAPGYIYTSSDSGVNWTLRDSYRNWVSAASSADGVKLVAVEINGQIYNSTDSGANWVARESNRRWMWVASSEDGSKLVAVVNGGQIFTSSDSGVTWIARESNRDWWSVASSADGSKLVAVINGGQIFTSSDSGTNWVAHGPNIFWRSVASSADGGKLVAASGRIYTSTDGGTNWVARENDRAWSSVASSADGSKLIALDQNGLIYTSTDSGTNWTATATSQNWYSAASSADGTKFVAAVNGGQVYTEILTTPLSGAQGSSVDLAYAGNGQWQPLNLAQVPGSPALLAANQTFSGANIFNNPANAFTGSGAGLTGLNAANLNGVLNNAQIPGLDTSKITSGTFSDSRLSTNVALRAGGNSFTGTQTISGGNVGIGIAPVSTLHVNGTARVQGADNWDVNNTEGDFRVGNDTQRFKIGVATGGGGAGDVWMRAQGGTARVFIKTPGGTTFYSNEGQTSGVSMAPGGGAWTSLSDRNAKENFEPVNAVEVLDKVAALPLTTWNYKSQATTFRHLGPMAQDFKAAFGLGESDTGITTVDADGVALAAIQGLNRKMAEKDARIAELERRLERLEQLVSAKSK